MRFFLVIPLSFTFSNPKMPFLQIIYSLTGGGGDGWKKNAVIKKFRQYLLRRKNTSQKAVVRCWMITLKPFLKNLKLQSCPNFSLLYTSCNYAYVCARMSSFLEWGNITRWKGNLLLRRFVFRMAEASAKRVTGDEPQGTMEMVQTAHHQKRDVWVRGRWKGLFKPTLY